MVNLKKEGSKNTNRIFKPLLTFTKQKLSLKLNGLLNSVLILMAKRISTFYSSSIKLSKNSNFKLLIDKYLVQD